MGIAGTISPEAYLKQQQDKAYYENAGQNQAQMLGADVCQEAKDPREPMAARFARLAVHTSRQGGDYLRAHRLLQEHPEFEELVWLIKSGLIYSI